MSKKKHTLVGLTGGIGSGKSALARFFQEQGIPVISADDVARVVTAPGSQALQKIQCIFGNEVINHNGTFNRIFVRKKILENAQLRKELEKITHPLIQAQTQKQVKQLFKQGYSLVIYEAPLLFEAKSDHGMDAIICVIADDKIRLKRIMARDSTNKEEAKKILAAQMPQEEKAAKSTYVISNNGDLAALKQNALEVLEKIKAKNH